MHTLQMPSCAVLWQAATAHDSLAAGAARVVVDVAGTSVAGAIACACGGERSRLASGVGAPPPPSASGTTGG